MQILRRNDEDKMVQYTIYKEIVTDHREAEPGQWDGTGLGNGMKAVCSSWVASSGSQRALPAITRRFAYGRDYRISLSQSKL